MNIFFRNTLLTPLLIIPLLACSNSSKPSHSSIYTYSTTQANQTSSIRTENNSTQTDSSNQTSKININMSHQINNGYNSELSYVDSGYEFAYDGRLKYWYTLMNADSITYLGASVHVTLHLDNRLATDSADLPAVVSELRPGESTTYYFYITKLELKNISNIDIEVSSTYCSDSDVHLFDIKGEIQSYKLELKEELNTLNVYSLTAQFLTNDNFLLLTSVKFKMLCYAEIIDIYGRLITWTILSGEPNTDYINYNQIIELTNDEINIPKDQAPYYSHVIFTNIHQYSF